MDLLGARAMILNLGVNKMRKKIIAIVALCVLVLNACGNEQATYGEEYVFQTDSQTFNPGLRQAVYTEEGYYVVNPGNGSEIEYIDTKSDKATTLCNKPGCKHNNELCNAYFEHGINSLVYYDNYLYVSSSDTEDAMTHCLYRVSLDGSERVKVTDMYRSDEEEGYILEGFLIHRGKGYLVINWTEESTEESEQSIYEVPLSGGEKEEVFTVTGCNPCIQFVFSNGNYVYYTVDTSNSETDKWEQKTYKLNVADDTTEEIDLPQDHIFLAEIDGKIYSMIKSNDDKNEIYVTDDSGTTNSLYLYESDMPIVYRDREYLYWDNSLSMSGTGTTKHAVNIMDYDGKCVRELVCSGNERVIWSDTKQVLVYDFDNNNYNLYGIEDGKKIQICS